MARPRVAFAFPLTFRGAAARSEFLVVASADGRSASLGPGEGLRVDAATLEFPGRGEAVCQDSRALGFPGARADRSRSPSRLRGIRERNYKRSRLHTASASLPDLQKKRLASDGSTLREGLPVPKTSADAGATALHGFYAL
jgi:hypothetical protein